MPYFPGERPITAEERAGDEFAYNAFPALRRFAVWSLEWFISVLRVDVEGVGEYDYLIARPPQAPPRPRYEGASGGLGRADRFPNPDFWWIWDADADEEPGWVPQATFNAEGFIYPRDADAEWDRITAALLGEGAEGDTVGAQSPRPSRLEALAQQAVDRSIANQRLPQGNTSVRDSLRERLAGLDPAEAVYRAEEDLSGMLMGANGLLGRAPSRRLSATPFPPEEEVTEEGELIEALEQQTLATLPFDVNGNPLVSAPGPQAPKSVWERIQANAVEGRPPPVPRSTWEIIRDQGKK